MEKQHEYTVKDAKKLLKSLKVGDDFLQRVDRGERKDPWKTYNDEAREPIRAYKERKNRASDRYSPERMLTSNDLAHFVYPDQQEEGVEAQDRAGTIAEAIQYLQGIIARNNEKFFPIDLERDNDSLMAGMKEEESKALKEALIHLIRTAYFIPLAEMERCWPDERFAQGDLARRRRAIFSMSSRSNAEYSFAGIISGPAEQVLKVVSDAAIAREHAVAEAVKEKKLGEISKPSAAVLRRENFKLTDGEQETLSKVLGQCRVFFARQKGVEPKHQKHITVEDLTLEDIKRALSAAPKALQDTAFEALRALERLQLLRVLLHRGNVKTFKQITEATPAWGDGSVSYHSIVDRDLSTSLAGLGYVDGSNYFHEKRRKQRQTGPVREQPISGRNPEPAMLWLADEEHVISPEREALPDGTILYKADLTVQKGCRATRFKAIATAVRMDEAILSNIKLLACTGSLVGCDVSDSEIDEFFGEANGVFFHKCSLAVGEGCIVRSGIVNKSKLNFKPGAQMKGVAFYDSTFDFHETTGELIFEDCDFSGTDLAKDDLVKIAASSKRCEFSRAQLAELESSGQDLTAIQARSTETQTKHLDSLIANTEGVRYTPFDWHRLMPAGPSIIVDMLDPVLRNIKGVPPSGVLSNAGLHGDLDPRLFALPLAKEHISELPDRIAAYKALGEFVGGSVGTALTFKTWFTFFNSFSPEDCHRLFGIDPMLLELGGDYFDALQARTPLELSLDERGRLKDETLYEGNKGRLGDKVERTERGGSTVRVAKMTKHLWLKQRLEVYLVNLQRFGAYLNDLLSKGYSYPELDESTVGFQFEGLVHPDVHQDIGAAAQRNTISLPHFSDGGVVNISSADNNDGKSTLVAAIALAVSQAQAGLPVPATRARFNPDAAVSGIMVMPNTRADAGQGEGVMAERARVYKELRARVQAVTQKGLLVLMDEITMGGTNAVDAATFDTNAVSQIVNESATVLAIVQDAAVIVPRWQEQLGANRVEIIAHTPAMKAHEFGTAAEAISSSPATVLAKLGMDDLLRTDWK